MENKFLNSIKLNKINETKLFLNNNPHIVYTNDSDGNNGLHIAAKGKNLKILKLLMKYSTDELLTEVNNDGNTIYEILELNGSYEEFQTLIEDVYDEKNIILIDNITYNIVEALELEETPF